MNFSRKSWIFGYQTCFLLESNTDLTYNNLAQHKNGKMKMKTVVLLLILIIIVNKKEYKLLLLATCLMYVTNAA